MSIAPTLAQRSPRRASMAAANLCRAAIQGGKFAARLPVEMPITTTIPRQIDVLRNLAHRLHYLTRTRDVLRIQRREVRLPRSSYRH